MKQYESMIKYTPLLLLAPFKLEEDMLYNNIYSQKDANVYNQKSLATNKDIYHH